MATKCKIRVQLGKSIKTTFESEYDSSDPQSVANTVSKYHDFYNDYRNTHSISARRWHFPTVYINDIPRYVVTPNGSWNVIEGETK